MPTKRSGFILLEVLLSVGLIAIFLSGLGGYLVIFGNGTARSQQETRATWAAQEGLDALQTIAYEDLPLTETGAIAFTSNRWELSSGSPQTIATGITRTVQVQEVARDASCQMVLSGGTSDPDSKLLKSTVTWIDIAGRSHELSHTSLRTRWDDPQGACFKPSAATCSEIDYLTSGEWFGGKQLRTVYFMNNCPTTTPVIDKMVFTWNNDALIQQVFIDSTKIWSNSGPGSPSEDQPNGTILDVQDFALEPTVIYELNKTQFSARMSGTTITITLIFTDGTSLTTPAFVPSG